MNKVDIMWGVLFLVLGALALLSAWGGPPLQEEDEELMEMVNQPEPAAVMTEIEFWPQDEEPEPVVETMDFNADIPLDADLQATLREACRNYGVPVPLMLGLIEQESNFDPYADSGAARGLCQLSRRYWPANLTPAENIREGCRYLAECLERWNSTEAALTAYNAGHDTGSRIYAGAVLARAAKWEMVLGED